MNDETGDRRMGADMDWRMMKAVIAGAIAAAAITSVAWWSLSDPWVRKALREGIPPPPKMCECPCPKQPS